MIIIFIFIAMLFASAYMIKSYFSMVAIFIMVLILNQYIKSEDFRMKIDKWL
jgi:hypothetical protein